MKNELDKLSDAEIVAMLKDKSTAEGAFAEFYSRYSQYVWAFCLKIIGNTDEASDVFQDSFTKFYNIASEGRITSNPKAYLLSIVRTTCFNYKRDHKKFVIIDDLNAIPDTFSTQNTYLDNEQSEIIKQAIDALPQDQKEVMVLRLYQGCSYSEIADIIGEPLSIVKNRLYRAREKVKADLARYLDD